MNLATDTGRAITCGPTDGVSAGLYDRAEALGGHSLESPFLPLTTDDVAAAERAIRQLAAPEIVDELLDMLGIDAAGLDVGIARGIYKDVRP